MHQSSNHSAINSLPRCNIIPPRLHRNWNYRSFKKKFNVFSYNGFAEWIQVTVGEDNEIWLICNFANAYISKMYLCFCVFMILWFCVCLSCEVEEELVQWGWWRDIIRNGEANLQTVGNKYHGNIMAIDIMAITIMTMVIMAIITHGTKHHGNKYHMANTVQTMLVIPSIRVGVMKALRIIVS